MPGLHAGAMGDVPPSLGARQRPLGACPHPQPARGIQQEPPQARPTGFFTKHETRITKHGVLVLKPFSLFPPPRPAWHEDSESGILEVDLLSERRSL